MSLVTTGWVVKKRWKTSRPDPKDKERRIITEHSKVISTSYVNRAAADTFCELAKKYPPKAHNKDEESVEYFVSDNITEDGLPNSL